MGSLQRAYGEEKHPPPVDRLIARVARRQSGVISTPELIECGLTKDGIASRVRRGHLHPLLRSVYAVGHTNLTRRGREWAVVLACGSDASLSYNYEDRVRDRRLKSTTGIETIRVTWEDLTSGRAALEHDLKKILARR